MKKLRYLGTLVSGSIVVAALAGCAAAPETTPSDGTASTDGVPCIVSGEGGFDDRSFNQLGLEGVQQAADELGVEPIAVESKSESDYAPNVRALVDQGCTSIVTLGFPMADVTSEAANSYPDIRFVLVDDNTVDQPNVKPVIWDTSQAGFLAGYAAAAVTETGKVGTYGGMNVPPVALYMDGFARGIEHYNSTTNGSVEIIGWNTSTQDGLFVGNFVDIAASRTMAQTLIDQGADIILPVGGAIYEGATSAARDAGGAVSVIGVDTDMAVSDPGNTDLFFTSIARDMPKIIAEAVKTSLTGDFTNEAYVGTLENSGVFLAPFHDFEDLITPELQAELDSLQQDVISGAIEIGSPYSP